VSQENKDKAEAAEVRTQQTQGFIQYNRLGLPQAASIPRRRKSAFYNHD